MRDKIHSRSRLIAVSTDLSANEGLTISKISGGTNSNGCLSRSALEAEIHATAATREEAVEQLRALIRQQLDAGALVLVEIPPENPLMSLFGHAKHDPYFEDYLNEIRKFREE